MSSCSEQADGCCHQSVAAWNQPPHLPAAVGFPVALNHMAVNIKLYSCRDDAASALPTGLLHTSGGKDKKKQNY